VGRPEKYYARWTEDEQRRAQEYARAGLDLVDIGRMLGRSADSVRNKLAKLRCGRALAGWSDLSLSRELTSRGWTCRKPGWLAEYCSVVKAYGGPTGPDGVYDRCVPPLREPVTPHADVSHGGVVMW
jgi:hypothetical protein